MWLIQSGFIQAENILALKLQCCCYNQLLLVSVDKNKCFEKAVSTGCDPADTDPRFCWTGSAVRGEWGSAHIRANLPRSPGHAHEDRDDVARRVQPDKQAEPRAHWAGVGGARSTKCWEERTTRQWHQVSHGTPRPQESAGSRIIWLESTLVCRVFHILKIFVYRSLPRFPPLIVITALFISPPIIATKRGPAVMEIWVPMFNILISCIIVVHLNTLLTLYCAAFTLRSYVIKHETHKKH